MFALINLFSVLQSSTSYNIPKNRTNVQLPFLIKFSFTPSFIGSSDPSLSAVNCIYEWLFVSSIVNIF